MLFAYRRCSHSATAVARRLATMRLRLSKTNLKMVVSMLSWSPTQRSRLPVFSELYLFSASPIVRSRLPVIAQLKSTLFSLVLMMSWGVWLTAVRRPTVVVNNQSTTILAARVSVLSYCVFMCVSLICLCVSILLCFHGQLIHLPYSFWR